MQSQQLREAIEAGKTEAVDALLVGDRDLLCVRYEDPTCLKRATGRSLTVLNPTPLMLAVGSWFAAVVRLLICWEAHVDDVFELREPPTDDEGPEVAVHFVTPLMIAAMTGRMEHCRALLDGGAKINARDSLGRTALYLACAEGHLTVVNLLLIENANLEAADEAQVTPLMAACANGHTSVVLHLVSVSAQLDKTDVNGQNVLFHAARGGVPSILEYLVDQSDDLLHCDKENRSLLMVAAAGGCEGVVDHLLINPGDYGLTPDSDVDAAGRNALFYAVIGRHLGMVKRLFQLDIPVQASASGETLLMAAARSAGPEMVRFLVENADAVGLDVHAIDGNGENCLFYAAANPDWQVFRYLAGQAGLKPQRNRQGRTPLMAAVVNGNRRLLDRMLTPCAVGEERSWCSQLHIDDVDEEGRDGLHLAALRGDVGLVRLLLESGASPRLNGRRQNVLMAACDSGALPAVDLLFTRFRFDLQQRDAQGRDVLFHCVTGGCLDALRLFDESGATRGEDEAGTTLVMAAALAGHATILKFLLDSGADEDCVSVVDHRGRNALFYAVSSPAANESILQLLLTAGCGVAPDSEGRTPLMEAARCGATDLVRFFLEHASQLGLDPNAMDRCGRNAVFYAAEGGSVEILRAFLNHGVRLESGGAAMISAAAHNRLRFAHRLLDELPASELAVEAGPEGNAVLAAVRGGHWECARALTARGVPVAASADGASPVAELYARGQAALAEELLELAPREALPDLLNGADLGTTGRTTFQHLALRGDRQRLSQLAWAFDSARDHDRAAGATLLILAAARGTTELVELLLEEFHVALSSVDTASDDALSAAARHGRLDNLKVLLAYGAPLRSSERVLHVLGAAVDGANERVLRHLVKYFLGAATAPAELRKAVSAQLATVVERMAQRGATGMFRATFEHLEPATLVAPLNAAGELAHHVAARCGHAELLEACLAMAPISGSIVDAKGNNPLHAACASSRLAFPVVAKLLEAGLDPETPNGEGVTPLQMAVQGRTLKAVRLLVEAGADPWRQNRQGLNSFELCASENGVIQVYLEKTFGLSCRQRHELDTLMPCLRVVNVDALAADLGSNGVVLCDQNARQVAACPDLGSKLVLLSRLFKRRSRGRVPQLCTRLAHFNEALAQDLQNRLTRCEAGDQGS